MRWGDERGEGKGALFHALEPCLIGSPSAHQYSCSHIFLEEATARAYA